MRKREQNKVTSDAQKKAFRKHNEKRKATRLPSIYLSEITYSAMEKLLKSGKFESKKAIIEKGIMMVYENEQSLKEAETEKTD